MTAAWGGLKPAPDSRHRRAYRHLPYSFDTKRMDASYFHPLCASAAHGDRAGLHTELQLVESDAGSTLHFPFSSTQHAKPAVYVTVASLVTVKRYSYYIVRLT
jgi:hypothetical protein